MNRDFKGIWIPREIWLNKTLSIQAKALWAEIWSLHDRESGGCYASNEYLCEFMDMKITRLKEVMKELRDLGFLIDVSFDGRHRVIRAELPETDYGGRQHAGKAAPSQPENRHADGHDSGTPSLYREQSLGYILDTPPIPPQKAAKAASEDVKDSSKPKREKPEFSAKVREVANEMINLAMQYETTYRAPKDLTQFLKSVQEMVEDEKQDMHVLMSSFEWAVSDNEKRGDFGGWRGVVCTNTVKGKPTNPARQFHRNLTKINSARQSKPKRKFDPSSDDNEALQKMKEMSARAI